VIDLSRYALSPLREGDSPSTAVPDSAIAPILVVAADESSLAVASGGLNTNMRSKPNLTPPWAARPVALDAPTTNRMTLCFEDPAGAPVDRLLGRPLDVSRFLRIAIPLAGALRRVHERGPQYIGTSSRPISLADTASGGVWLTGFGIASRLPASIKYPRHRR